MYGLTLFLHSWLRWAILILLLIKLVQAFGGWTQNKAWTPRDKRFNLFTMIAVDLQLVLGLILYFVYSPYGAKAFKLGMKTVMKNKVFRFWAVEHLTLMLVAWVLIHVGYAISKRSDDDKRRHKVTALTYGFALLAILVSIPWPFMKNVGRNLFKLSFGG